MSDTTTATVMVEDAAVKEGAKDGKPWKKVGLKDANGEYYSTFDSALGQRVIEAIGKRAEIVWKPSKNPQFKDLLSISPVEDNPIAARAEDGTADWDLIGLRKTRCLLWADFLQSPLAAWLAAQPEEGKPATSRVFDFGQAVIAMAEADIYHRVPADESEMTPF